MSVPAPHQGDSLILAIDESTDGIGEELMRLSADESQPDVARKFLVGGAGDALRLIYRHEPQAVFVCVGLSRMDASAALIETLRRRRPRLPLLAVAAEHDEAIERAVRTAGVTYYFALSADERQLRDALLKMEIWPTATHSGLSPPRSGSRSRAQPALRSRPRYGRSSFD